MKCFNTRCISTCSTAIVRNIDPSIALLAQTQQLSSANLKLDINRAYDEHREYIRVLQSLNLKIITLPSDGYPDSVFIEDTMVSDGHVILITRPGALTRRNEIKRVKEYLLSPINLEIQRNYSIHELSHGNLDGGDVLFTGLSFASFLAFMSLSSIGREFFIGRSRRTDNVGIEYFKKVFHRYPVHVSFLWNIQIIHRNSSI